MSAVEEYKLTKDDLAPVRFWLKKYPGGVKGFAQDNKKSYSSVNDVLNARYFDSNILDKAQEEALKISTRITSRLTMLKEHYQTFKQ